MKYVSTSQQKTREFAKKIAKRVIAKPLSEKGASVIALEGELGAGKTTFVQGFVRAFDLPQKAVKSPTFLLMKRYPISSKRFTSLYHLDCYRISRPKELDILNIKEVLSDKEAIVLVEWAERIRTILPRMFIAIQFEHINKNKRKITVLNAKFKNKSSK